MDTIFAPASGRARAGVAVIRVSGPESERAIMRLTGRKPPEARRLVLCTLRDENGGVLDSGLVVVFAPGASFTGESSAELHVHGSIAVVDSVLRCLGRMPGLRLAEAGEFTRRALENGRLDLAEVEGLGDLIAAETELQRRQALSLARGGLRQQVGEWRQCLVSVLALLEACIDFPEEEIPPSVLAEAERGIVALIDGLIREIDGFRMAERIREGFEVAIVGPPNVGKSTLLNALAGREAAITSEHAGTTRDVIEVRMDLDGVPVTFLDTAGLRDTVDEVEAKGIARARERAKGADLRIILIKEPGDAPIMTPVEGDMVLLGRADLFPDFKGMRVSGRSGEGVGVMTKAIGALLSGRAALASGISRARHREAVLGALGSLEMARDGLEDGETGIELVAEALRVTMGRLERLIGRVDVEDVLGEIFGSFCIGK